MTLVLEVKGYEDDVDKAKRNTGLRWISAVNTWDELGKWKFYVCRDPHLLERDLELFVSSADDIPTRDDDVAFELH